MEVTIDEMKVMKRLARKNLAVVLINVSEKNELEWVVVALPIRNKYIASLLREVANRLEQE